MNSPEKTSWQFLRSLAFPAMLLPLSPGPASADSLIEAATRYTVKLRVSIETPFWPDDKGTSNGTGFLVDKQRGWMLTNAHIAGRSPAKINVIFKDRPPVAGHSVYIDSHLDMAIVQVPQAAIPATAEEARLGCSDPVVPGQQVVAFGHPWSLDFTATRGIVSGVRFLGDTESIQTDATINPGNSGGALIDERTQHVIGLNEATYGSNRSSIGIATPIRLACTIIDLLRNGQDPAPPKLPATFATTTIDGELYVASIRDAWNGLLQTGDRLKAINGEPQRIYISRIIDKSRGRKTIDLTYDRGGVEHSVTLPVPTGKARVGNEGLVVAGMLIAKSPFEDLFRNVMHVHYVEEASLAEISHFRKNDQIVSIDGAPIADVQQARAVLKDKRDQQVLFIVRRKKAADDMSFRHIAIKMTPGDVMPLSTEPQSPQPAIANDTSLRPAVR